jgi:hypothetical protein
MLLLLPLLLVLVQVLQVPQVLALRCMVDKTHRMLTRSVIELWCRLRMAVSTAPPRLRPFPLPRLETGVGRGRCKWRGRGG